MHQVSCTFRNAGVFFSSGTYLFENGTLVKTLGSLCRNMFRVHCHPSLGARSVPCAVRHACMCVIRCCFSQKNKTGSKSKQLGWDFEIEDASLALASVPFSFFSFVFFFLFPVCFLNVCVDIILYSSNSRSSTGVGT